MLNENNKNNEIKENLDFEIDEHLLNGGLGGVNMGFGIPANAKTGGDGTPYMDYINAKVKS